MTPRQLLSLAQADGVMVALTAAGRLKLSGDQLAIDRWLGTVGQYSSQIIAELSARAESGPMDGDHLPAAMSLSPDGSRRALEPGIGLTTKGIEE
ncbi:MAG: hypothetical protein WCV99_12400 [Sterolibacterium sp.]|jgi:hypothetical protein